MAQTESCSWFYFIIAGLAVWRVAHLIHAEDGPFDLIVRLRRAAGQGLLGSLMDCFYCLSLWIAVPPAWFLGRDWPERLLLWPALSGAAIFMERVHGALSARDEPSPVPYFEEEPEE